MSILKKHINIKFTTKEDWLSSIQQLFPYEIDTDKFEVKNNILYLYNSNNYGMKILITPQVLDMLDKTDINLIKFETSPLEVDLYYPVVVGIKKACLNKFNRQLELIYSNPDLVKFELV